MGNSILFSINAVEMKKVVSQLDPIIKSSFEDLPKVLFQVEKDKITAFAKNEDSYIKIVFKGENTNKGEFVVSGTKLSEIVKSTTDEKITFSLAEKNELLISAGMFNYNIGLIDAESKHLIAPEMPNSKSFSINAKDLCDAISSVICCLEPSKAHLYCVMIHSNEEEKNKICVVATDCMRLGISQKKTIINDKIPNLMIPKKNAEYIIKLINGIQDNIEICYSENTIQISIGNTIFYTSKLFDSNFPKYQSVIPNNNDKILEVKTANLKDSLKRTTAVSTDRGNNVVEMTLTSDKITITCKDSGDRSTTDVEATFSGKAKIQINFNYKMLLEILDKISSSIVRIQISDNQSPMLIRPVDDESVKYVFMPIVSNN